MTKRQNFHTDDVESVRNQVISADWMLDWLYCSSHCFRLQRSNTMYKRNKSITKQSIFVEYVLLYKKHLSFA